MSDTKQAIQQELIESVPATAYDAVLFHLGSLQGVVSLESRSATLEATIHPVVTVHDPNDEFGLKAVIGPRVEEVPDLSEEQQVQALVIDGINRMIESNSLHGATIKRVQAELEDLAANVQ